jgi:hypothetical protein
MKHLGLLVSSALIGAAMWIAVSYGAERTVLTTIGSWRIEKKVDAMTDKASCLALHESGPQIQLRKRRDLFFLGHADSLMRTIAHRDQRASYVLRLVAAQASVKFQIAERSLKSSPTNLSSNISAYWITRQPGKASLTL